MTQQSSPLRVAESSWPWAVRLAVAVSVLATVAADVVAGAAAGHVLALAMVASAVAVMRVRAAGHRRGVWSFVSAGLVAQPAFHVAADLARHVAPIGVHEHASATTSAVAAVVQAVVAAAIVAAVCLTERVVELAVSEVGAYLLAMRLDVVIEPAEPARVDVAVDEGGLRPPVRLWMGTIARRGPPVPVFAV